MPCIMFSVSLVPFLASGTMRYGDLVIKSDETKRSLQGICMVVKKINTENEYATCMRICIALYSK